MTNVINKHDVEGSCTSRTAQSWGASSSLTFPLGKPHPDLARYPCTSNTYISGMKKVTVEAFLTAEKEDIH